MTGSDTLSDPGGSRPVFSRWVVCFDLVLSGPCSIGGEGSWTDPLDMTALSDPLEGVPLLPGTSLAGALKNHLADYIEGYGKKPGENSVKAKIQAFIGSSEPSGGTGRSSLIAFDSLGKLDGGKPGIRDGVSIDPARGTAMDGFKFDAEVLPAGTLFPIRFDLVVPSEEEEAPFLSLLSTCMLGLDSGEIRLGRKKSRGWGIFSTKNWRVRKFSLNHAEGWIEWISAPHETPIPPGHPVFASARDCLSLLAPPVSGQMNKRAVFELKLELAGEFLVRAIPENIQEPDVVPLFSGGKPVIPGTSLAGAMRQRASKIASFLREKEGDADAWIMDIFGGKKEGTEASQTPSRLFVNEAVIEDYRERDTQRVRIDRFSQGTWDGALFDEKVIDGGRAEARIELKNPTDPETGLLLLVAKDLLTGLLPIGGSASTGRGRFRGTARLDLGDGRGATIGENLETDPDTAALLDSLVRSFLVAPRLQVRGKEEGSK